MNQNLQQLAYQHFNLELPCTQDGLKSAYRIAAKKLHSDTGGTDALFIEMKKAYDLLCAAPEVITLSVLNSNGFVDRRAMTFEGDLLSSLGLGLGPTINGKDCPRCDRKGFTTISKSYPEICTKCKGHGDIILCRACKGSGQYTNPVNRKVPCRQCDAKGYRPSPRITLVDWFGIRGFKRAMGAIDCPDCGATGKTQKIIKQFTHYRCGDCNGTGEIKIYNPVIMKNGLYTQKQRKGMK